MSDPAAGREVASPPAWPWRLGAWALAFVVATMLARGLRLLLTGRARLGAGEGATAEPYFLLYRATGAAAAVLATWLVVRRLDRRRLADVGLGGGARAAAGDVSRGALLAAIVFAAGAAALLASGRAHLALAVPDWRALALQAVPATALVGLYEELVFRGYPLQVLIERFRPRAAIAAVAVVFGLFHLPNPGVTLAGAAATVLWSLLLGALLVRTRSLWTCVGFHFAGNLVQAAVLGSPASGTSYGTSLLRVELDPSWLAGWPSGLEAAPSTLLAGAVALAWVLRGSAWAPRPGGRVLFPEEP